MLGLTAYQCGAILAGGDTENLLDSYGLQELKKNHVMVEYTLKDSDPQYTLRYAEKVEDVEDVENVIGEIWKKSRGPLFYMKRFVCGYYHGRCFHVISYSDMDIMEGFRDTIQKRNLPVIIDSIIQVTPFQQIPIDF